MIKLDIYKIILLKNNIKHISTKLNFIDGRIFYKHLKKITENIKIKYKINDETLYIKVNEKEFFRNKLLLKKYGIETIQDVIDYSEIIPIYIIIDGETCIDFNITIDNLYTVELYSELKYLTPKRYKTLL